jgi:predicted DNA-binding transcriptional regulator AlpA
MEIVMNAGKESFLSAKELEGMYGFPRPTMRRWYNKGIMPRPLKMDGKLYWRREWIDEWLGAAVSRQRAGQQVAI